MSDEFGYSHFVSGNGQLHLPAIGISIANAYVNDSGIFSYLLPSGLKTDLIAVDTHDLTLALACLPAYCLIFGILAWLRFKSRNF